MGFRVQAMSSLLTPFIQRQRLQIVAPYLQGAVLDLGCGLALASQYLKHGQRYVGVEGSQPFLDYLNRNFPAHSFYLRDLDHELLDINEKFDTILMAAVIEHLAHPDFLLNQLPGYLNPNATILITTPTPFGDIIHRYGARFGLFSQAAVEDHEIIYAYKTMQLRLSQSGIKIEEYRTFLLGGNQLFVCKSMVTA